MVIESFRAVDFLKQRGSLPFLSVLYGEDPFFRTHVTDSFRDYFREYAQKEGERFVFECPAASHMTKLDVLIKNDSLLSSSRFFEVMASSKQADQLLSFLYSFYPQSDLFFLLCLPALSWSEKKSKWFSSWTKKENVSFFSCEALPEKAFRFYMCDALKKKGFVFSNDLVDFLSGFFEGSALGFSQALTQLSLCLSPGRLSVQDVQAHLLSVVDYQVDDCISAIWMRDRSRFVRVLHSLREKDPFVISLLLWCFARDLRIFAECLEPTSQARQAIFMKNKVPQNRQPILTEALHFLTYGDVVSLFSTVGALDKKNKGVVSGDPWDDFFWMGFSLSGRAK